MHKGGWTPSAPPIAFGPVVHVAPSTPPPPNVRTYPPPLVAPAHGVAHRPMLSAAVSMAPPAQAPGVLGLILFAAPLAFAVMAIAALALL